MKATIHLYQSEHNQVSAQHAERLLAGFNVAKAEVAAGGDSVSYSSAISTHHRTNLEEAFGSYKANGFLPVSTTLHFGA